MKIKIFTSFLILLVSLVSFGPKAYSENLGAVEVNLCIAQFPCHLKSGKLLPGFKAGAPCNFEQICSKFRKSAQFIKLQKKLQKQRINSKRRERRDLSS